MDAPLESLDVAVVHGNAYNKHTPQLNLCQIRKSIRLMPGLLVSSRRPQLNALLDAFAKA